MKIKLLRWLSKPAKEAELVVTDGEYECLVFSQPCDVDLGDVLTEPLHPLEVVNLMKVDTHTAKIEKLNTSYFAHRFVARIIDLDKSIVAVGNIKIELDTPLLSWAGEGSFTEFTCARMDVW